jgi:hypothetical protein
MTGERKRGTKGNGEKPAKQGKKIGGVVSAKT